MERTEAFFWWFCAADVELGKDRAYAAHGVARSPSARPALRQALHGIHRLFAPFIPFVTDEVWSWWQQGSVHSHPWPSPAGGAGDSAMLDPVGEVLATIRRTKTEAKTSQKTEVATVVVGGPAATRVMILSLIHIRRCRRAI